MDEKTGELLANKNGKDALVVATNAFCFARQTWGEKDRRTATSLNKVAWAHYHAGDREKSQEVLRRAWKLWWRNVIPQDKEQFGTNSIEVAEDYFRASSVFMCVGMEAHGVECMEQCVTIMEQRRGVDDEEYLTYLARLVEFCQMGCETEKAEKYSKKYKRLTQQ